MRSSNIRTLALLSSLSLCSATRAPAQGALVDDAEFRRTAILNTLNERARRVGTRLPVDACSVVDAIEIDRAIIGESRDLRADLKGNLVRARCRMAIDGRDSSAWSPFIEMEAVRLETRDAPRSSVSVSLRVWEDSATYTFERYTFVVRAGAPWGLQSLEDRCCLIVEGPIPSAQTPLIMLNGEPLMPGTGINEALLRVRGHVIDSVKVLPAKDRSTARYSRYGASNGSVLIWTHVPEARRR